MLLVAAQLCDESAHIAAQLLATDGAIPVLVGVRARQRLEERVREQPVREPRVLEGELGTLGAREHDRTGAPREVLKDVAVAFEEPRTVARAASARLHARRDNEPARDRACTETEARGVGELRLLCRLVTLPRLARVHEKELLTRLDADEQP